MGILLFISLAALIAEPGSSREVRGVVRDQHGAGIPRARIEIVCGSERRRAVTLDGGEFSVSGLPAARCSVAADAESFELARTSVDLTGSSAVVTPLTLRIRGLRAEVVVTATRGSEERAFEVPESLSVVSRREIDSTPHQLLAQVLREQPGILLQQTTSAQASPVIRGFTGQSNVYLVEGVRFNTSAWRPGPSQYLAWIYPAAINRIEIVRGPGSVQYGSDALGGTINLLTAPPTLLPGGLRLGGTIEGLVGFADKAGTVDADIVLQTRMAAVRIGGGSRRVQDLRAGKGIDSHAAVTRFLGLPSTILGDRLRGTGFTQSGGYALARVAAGAGAEVSVVYLHDVQGGASRYDRTFGGEGLYRSGFDPQALDFGLIRYQKRGARIFDEWSGGISINRQVDGRYEQSRPTARLDSQATTTTALGYQIQGHRQFGRGNTFLIGSEFYDEAISAFRVLENPLARTSVAARPDIPNGTSYTNLGVFAQVTSDIVPARLLVRGGVRYGRFGFRTVRDAAMNVPAERVDSAAVTFQGGAVARLTRHVHATFNGSRGFRAANAADLGGIGLTGGGGFEITPTRAIELGGSIGTSDGPDAVSTGQPIEQLGPEVVYAFEPGLKFRGERFSAALTAYDLELHDTIQRRVVVFAAPVVGLNIAGYDIVRNDDVGRAYITQDPRPIVTRVNVDRARILGFDADASVQLARDWVASGYVSMSNGRVLNGDYLRRMSPPLASLRIRWTAPAGSRWVEGIVSWAGRQSRLSTAERADARIGARRTRDSIAAYFNGTAIDLGLVRNGVLLATGESLTGVQNRLLGSDSAAQLFTSTPGFFVVGLRGGWRLGSQIEMTILGDNLSDRNYRLHGSGVDAPGFNLQVRARYRF